MWNNGFPGQGNFQQGQGNFSQSYGEDGFIPFSPMNPGQQQFSQGQYFSMDYNNPASASQYSTPGEYSPEINLYDDGAFIHNQFSNSDGSEQHIPQRPATAGIGSSRPALTARAEELKAQLLKSKERARSGTPPIITVNSASKPSKPTEGSMPFRGSPNTPLSGSDGPTASRRTSGVMDEDLNDLISEAKAAADVKSESKLNGSSVTKSKEPTIVDPRTKSRAPITGTSTRGMNGERDVKNDQGKPIVKTLTRNETNGELSDTSEGEIREAAMTDKSPLHTVTIENKNTAKQHRSLESLNPKIRLDEDGKTKQNYGNQERRQTDSRSVPQAKSTRAFTERHEEVDRTERKGNHSEIKNDQMRRPDVDHRQYEPKVKSKPKDTVSRKPEAPTLAQLLLVDEDLKDWLEVTGYHNEEYRQKILNRRRALAALDAQKAKLLEEIENEERGGMSTKASSVGMLPPPMPSKISAVAPAVAKKEVSAPKSSEPNASTKMEQETRPKRSYAEYHGSHDQDGAEKIARIEERTPQKEQGSGIKNKTDSPTEARRPQSRGYGLSRRRSPSPRRRSPSPRRRSPSPRRRSLSADNRALRRDDKDSSRKSRSPDRGHKSSYQIKRSPSHESHENKRLKLHEYSPPHPDQDRSDYKGRPFIQVGNYRGRAYDPYYRTRGRGRGHWQEPREPYFEPRPSQPVTQLEQRVAAMKPYLDSKPLDLGGRGDTRYFIVKSFNEENIMRCIEDSIWTTQIENGDLFKSAFVTCKNVILVFSANQSRAFQGYARMENTPGSEKAPAWQNNIHWESAGAFKVKWICVANTRFNRVGHLKNKLNENHPVLVGRDGQEIEEHAGSELLKLINEEAERLLDRHTKPIVPTLWDE